MLRANNASQAYFLDLPTYLFSTTDFILIIRGNEDRLSRTGQDAIFLRICAINWDK